MQVLILGGTRFLGRAIVDAALGRGDTVTLFNRGRTNPGLYPGIETVTGDRTGDLKELSGRHWDVVVDVAAYEPDVVRRNLAVLAGQAEHYVFVSTISVYADHSVPQFEDSAVLEVRDDLPEEFRYGALKMAAERHVAAAFGERSLIVRAGLIVGPHDGTDRFAYWPRRIAAGGRVLAPGERSDPVQFIDVRDLAEWIVDGYRRNLGGVFNLTGRRVPIGELLRECVTVTGSHAQLRWISTARLLAAGVEPWMGVPLWVADPDREAVHQADISRALAEGLTFRPLPRTIRDTLSWDLARGGPATPGLTAAAERRLLEMAAAW
jgi:2'-hydroxyisoflavone reductase